MNSYTVAMQSGHTYHVMAESHTAALYEAERLARVLHGTVDAGVVAIEL